MYEAVFKSVAERIDSSDQDIINWQSALTAIPAISPESGGQGEKEKADLLKTLLAGFSPDALYDVNAPDERVPAGYRPNLVAEFAGEKRDRKIWIIFHLDVVPPGELRLWKSDPFKVKVEGDKIFGRGVEDNQQSVVTFLVALKALQLSLIHI